jgi:hypothetical protein
MPARGASSFPHSGSSVADEPELVGRRVLLVDDDDTGQRFLRPRMESWRMRWVDVLSDDDARTRENAQAWKKNVAIMFMRGLSG